MIDFKKHRLITFLIASVWMVNGLVCKVLNLIPRHEEIVAQILNEPFSRQLTVLIGVAEIIMAIWILSGFKSRINAYLQMVIIAIMNILEFMLVPELLLWGRLNLLFAVLFIGLIYSNEFILKRKIEQVGLQ